MSTLNYSTLRPGLLISLKTTVSGNVSYEKNVIEEEHTDESGAVVSAWQTRRSIEDAEEFERAKQVRGKARNMIAGTCSWSSFGLLCPDTRIPNLEQAIRDAQRLADEFNATANITRINVYVMSGRVAQDDVQAAKAINSEVRELMEQMASGIQRLDPKAVREAANKAKKLGSMLQPDASEKLESAIKAARAASCDLVKAGEQAAQAIDHAAIRKIAECRTAFLDLDDAGGVEMAMPMPEASAIDLMPPDDMISPASPTAAAPNGWDLAETMPDLPDDMQVDAPAPALELE